MRDSVAPIVHSIIRHGLALRDRLEAGETLDPAAEHNTLRGMLAPLALEEVWDAEEEAAFGVELAAPNSPEVHARLSQATIRYALVAWLDAFLVRYSLWGSTWNDHSLGGALFGNDRQGRHFWEEARYAETRKDLDALEVLYWCVMLGFRGEGRGLTEPTGVWTTRIRALLDDVAHRADALPAPLDRQVQPAVVRVSELPYRRMAFMALATFSLVVSAGLWLAWRHWPFSV